MEEKHTVRLVQPMEGEDIPWTSLQPVGNHSDSVCLCACHVTVNVLCVPTCHHWLCVSWGKTPQVELARVAVHSVQRYFCTWHIVYITVVTMALIVQYVNVPFLFRFILLNNSTILQSVVWKDK